MFAAIGTCGLFALQRLPWTLHIYILFPFYFWDDVVGKLYANWSAFGRQKLDVKWVVSSLFGLLLAAVVLQSMVVRFSHPIVP
jgi:hypothetical protein